MIQTKRPLALFAALGVVALLAAACGGDGGSGTGSGNGKLSGASFTVGSKEFTEQLILGNITKLALENAGATVKDQIGLQGTEAARGALTSGQIDMYWEYTGTGWVTLLKNSKPIPDARKQYAAVAKQDLAKNGIKWMKAAPMNNTYGFAVAKEKGQQLGVTTISDFAKLANDNPSQATLCVASEFTTRDDGLPGVQKTYGFQISKDNLSTVDLGIVYNSIDKGKPCNFGEVFTTDGRIDALGLTVLEDDKSFFPLYNAALTVRKSVYDKYGAQLDSIFNPISSKLTNATMRKLNAAVDVDGQDPEDVASEFLTNAGLI